jgi:hypothetical protein
MPLVSVALRGYITAIIFDIHERKLIQDDSEAKRINQTLLKIKVKSKNLRKQNETKQNHVKFY